MGRVAELAALFFLLTIASVVYIPEHVRAEPGIDYIVIVDGPNGTGLWVSERNYSFGDSDVFWAAGYNSTTSGWVADVAVHWFIGPGPGQDTRVIRVNSSYGSSVRVDTNGYGAITLKATYYYGPGGGNATVTNETGPLQVSVANVDSVVIRTAPGGQGSWVGPTTYFPTAVDWFFAAAYNTTRGFLGDITANWTSSNATVGPVDSDIKYPPSGRFVALAPGFTYVTAEPVGTTLSNTTGRLTVIGIDYIQIVDASGGAGSWVSERDYVFGNTDVFWAAGYNQTSGWVADMPVSWWGWYNPAGNLSNSVVRTNATGGPSVRVDTNGYGVATLRALWNGTKLLTNYTGPLRVSVANVDSVVIRSDRGGTGTWVGDTTYFIGDADVFYAAAYNASAGFLGDITANWTSSNATVGTVYGSSGSQCDGASDPGNPLCYPRAMFAPRGVGVTYVTAEPIGTALSNTTGRLTVTTIGVNDVQIRDAPNGGGVVLGDRTYYVAEQDTFYAASYNRTLGYLGDIVGTWSSNDTSVCEVRAYNGNQARGSSVQVLMKSPGVCAVTVAASPPSGPIGNTTGLLTVKARTTVTVDDSGGADFRRIQDAIDYAQNGYRVLVYAGTYAETVVVRKELEIVGTSRGDVVLDGGGRDALLIAADRVVVHNLTIRNAHYGIFQDHTNNTRVYDTVIQDYAIGLYNNRTLNAWVAHNLITRGRIGILTNESYDDAIRWNYITYNTVYGAKSFNTRLRNCFNWNDFHRNAVAYYHDPTTEYPPMEFDGNTLEDNEVGVRVENTSSITLTNNTFVGGAMGLELLNSSAAADRNTFSGLGVGIRCVASYSNLTNNVVFAETSGIMCTGGAPRIEGNDITVASGAAITLANVDGAVVRGNDLHGGTIRIVNSHLAMLEVVNGVAVLEDSNADQVVIDAVSRLEVRWTVRVKAADPAGAGLAGAHVRAADARGNVVFEGATGGDGYTASFPLVAEVRTAAGIESSNPFTFEVAHGGVAVTRTVTVSGPMDLVVTVPAAPVPWPTVAALALASVAFASLAAVFGIERTRYAFLALFVPLYTRLSRDKSLANYNRGRVYGYIELNPGTHFNAILAALDMNNGTLVYHLEVLQREGLVTSRQEGMYRRFYPQGMEPPPVLENGTTEAQLRVLRAIQEMPGITQKELARFLGLRQSTLAYQIDKLTTAGYIAAEKQGRKVRYTTKRGRT